MSDNGHHAVVDTLFSFFKNNGVPYSSYTHKEVKTSEEAASARPGYSIEQGVKALIVTLRKDRRKSHAQIVVPGHKKFSSRKVRHALGADSVSFCTESEMREITGGVEPGGVPPFGNLFSLPVYVDEGVFSNDTIIFNCGDRRVSAAITSADYKKLLGESITVGDFC